MVDTGDFPSTGKTQIGLAALQCMVAAMCARLLASEANIDDGAKAIMDMALGSARKLDFPGNVTPDQAEAARISIETSISELVTASARSAQLKNQGHPRGKGQAQ